MSTAQQQFDETYISSREIIKRLEVTRPTVSQAHRRGLLPAPIVVNETHFWLRKDVEAILDAWKLMLDRKRAGRKA